MNRLIGLLLTAFPVVSCDLALAQNVGRPIAELPDQQLKDDARSREFKMRDFRGRIIFLYFWRHNHPSSERLVPKVQQLETTYGPRGVAFISVMPGAKEDAEATLKEKWPTVPDQFYGSLWLDHFDVVSYPYVMIVDPDGIVAWKGIPGDDIEERLKYQLQRTPPIGADEAALKARLTKAEELAAKKEYARAYTLARSVELLTSEASPLNGQAASQQQQLVEKANEWLKEASEAHNSGDNAKACRIPAEISVRFATEKKEGDLADLISAAETEIGRLRADGATKDMVEKAIDTARAELRMEEAADYESQNSFTQALRLYREVTEKYPKTAVAKEAKASLDRLTSDAKLKAGLKGQRERDEAQRWLDIAERYERLRLFPMARDTYNEIVQKHPRSPAAAKARDALKKLPKDGDAEPAKGERADAGKP